MTTFLSVGLNLGLCWIEVVVDYMRRLQVPLDELDGSFCSYFQQRTDSLYFILNGY